MDPQGQNLLQLLDKFQREKASIGGTAWPIVRRRSSTGSPQVPFAFLFFSVHEFCNLIGQTHPK